jgi:hypothetical protein
VTSGDVTTRKARTGLSDKECAVGEKSCTRSEKPPKDGGGIENAIATISSDVAISVKAKLYLYGYLARQRRPEH